MWVAVFGNEVSGAHDQDVHLRQFGEFGRDHYCVVDHDEG